MTRALSVFVIFAATALLACSGASPTDSDSNVVRTLIIRGDGVDTISSFGPHQLSSIGLNSNRVEVAPETYVTYWKSLDPTIATVADGLVNIVKNGTVRIVATAFQATDTVTLVVLQQASRVSTAQDTIVALVQGAIRLSGPGIGSDTMRVTAVTTDANGFSAPRTGVISWTPGPGTSFTLVPAGAGGDTVRIIGSARETGSVTVSLGSFSSVVPVQVVDQYSVVRIATGAGGTTVTPSSLTIPIGTAVVFLNGDPDAQKANGGSWRTAFIPGLGKEAQVFTLPGTFSYQIGSAMGSIVVTP